MAKKCNSNFHIACVDGIRRFLIPSYVGVLCETMKFLECTFLRKGYCLLLGRYSFILGLDNVR
jgi:hypothetical protein